MITPGVSSSSMLIAHESIVFIFRERTVALLSVLFIALVLVSAYLGWSATHTVNAIYIEAAHSLKNSGHPVPPNPVLEISPLSLLRNMSIYVMLIGSLSAIVVGHKLISTDRKSGVMPLLGTRPFHQCAYVKGKIVALAGVIFGLISVALLVSITTFLLLPEFQLSGTNWLKFAGFFCASYGYMLFFGLTALASSASARSESIGLLMPVTIWLTLTFILPSITANIHPTAAINPISALAPPPDLPFFQWVSWFVGPFSIAESYKFLSAGLLDFLPETARFSSPVSPLAELLIALTVMCSLAVRAMLNMDNSSGDYDV